MNGIFVGLPKEIFIIVYADDILLLVIGKTLKAMKVKLQAAVSAVSRWAANTGFDISAEKSSILHVCRLSHRPPSAPITLNGCTIPRKRTMPVLGVTLDRNFRFGTHMNETRANCRTRINILRSLSGTHSINNRGTILNTAKAIVHSRLMYGIELLCAANDSIVNRLGPIYNQAIRTAARLLPSTPADAACVEMGVLPFRFFVAESICSRAIGLDEKLAGDGEFYLLSEGNRILQEIAHQELPPVARIHWYGAREWDASPIHVDKSIARKFRAGDSSPAMRAHLAEVLRSRYAGYQVRYTDGSKANGRVGFGVTDGGTSHFWQLPSQCSVLSAEAAALHLAATLPSTSPICILTDSASSLAALESATPHHPWIQAIQEHAPSNCTFMWVPGHCGIAGNIEADHLAATGRTGRLALKSVPRQDCKAWIRSTLRTVWSEEWSARGDLFLRKVKGETTSWTDIRNAQDQRALSRLRTGHTRLTHNMGGGGAFRRRCEACNTTMTVEHILIDCPCFHGPREQYGIPGNIRDALQNDPSSEAALIVFLKEAGIYKQL